VTARPEIGSGEGSELAALGPVDQAFAHHDVIDRAKTHGFGYSP
jgi:hypothetical protein